MEIVEPKPKRFSNVLDPAKIKNFESRITLKGVFNGFSVYVKERKHMKKTFELGCFGKGNFSRSFPRRFNDDAEIIRYRQYFNRMDWTLKNVDRKHTFRKIIIVPDSDDDSENYFSHLMPEYDFDRSGIDEVLTLSLEEAFFLTSCAKVMSIFLFRGMTPLQPEEAWAKFKESDPNFVYNYAAYLYFRSKNWVVKPAEKFGGDFLLYKKGPAYYHASYVVIIDVLNHNHERIDQFSKRSMDNISLLNLHRLCETAGKELMICQVILPEEEIRDYNDLNKMTVKEILMNRWTESEGCS